MDLKKKERLILLGQMIIIHKIIPRNIKKKKNIHNWNLNDQNTLENRTILLTKFFNFIFNFINNFID